MKEKVWRDTSARLEGPAIADLSYAFDHTWRRSQPVNDTTVLKLPFFIQRRRGVSESPIGLNFTRKMRKFYRLRFLQKIEAANTRVWISNAYLAPPSSILRKLVMAAKRGVDVRILIPARSDVWFMPFISRAYYRSFLKAGVRIFEYQPRFMHAKSMIIDQEVIIGTSNLNRRSFLHDLEVDVTLDHPTTLQVMTDQYLLDLTHAAEITKKSSVVGSTLGSILNYLFRYWV